MKKGTTKGKAVNFLDSEKEVLANLKDILSRNQSLSLNDRLEMIKNLVIDALANDGYVNPSRLIPAYIDIIKDYKSKPVVLRLVKNGEKISSRSRELKDDEIETYNATEKELCKKLLQLIRTKDNDTVTAISSTIDSFLTIPVEKKTVKRIETTPYEENDVLASLIKKLRQIYLYGDINSRASVRGIINQSFDEMQPAGRKRG